MFSFKILSLKFQQINSLKDVNFCISCVLKHPFVKGWYTKRKVYLLQKSASNVLGTKANCDGFGAGRGGRGLGQQPTQRRRGVAVRGSAARA